MTGTKEQTADETENNLTPESTEEDSPMNENSETSSKKTEKLPEESTNSSFFSAYEEETMSKGGSSTPRSKLKEEKSQTQMMIEISTAVLEEMEKKKKDKGFKTQTEKIFNRKSKDPELMFDKLKDEFKKHYLLADIQAEAQIQIEVMKMTKRADNYVNDFWVMADESGYDDQALIHIFRKGLPNSLAAKILNQPQRRPSDLEGWYEAAIRYDKQYKYYEAVQKLKKFRVVNDKKKVTINWVGTQLNDEEQKKYMADGRCFRCAKQGHMARDCPTKQGEKREEKKKLSTRKAYVKIQAIVREQEAEQQTELMDIMEAEGF
ncbi:hypothetical protein Moror_15159 [Moniliophthora roreri MCA 2997]|uniref:CCHC-type domain-containing protein n=1 Tax=Moniliophthora roreri (strain MCA 2997) TaxID=1381753 RepID=V2X1Y8_MONRO|nr:hypothetical protein Moror_15159 [Moniliophthora roreri MCA 2997]